MLSGNNPLSRPLAGIFSLAGPTLNENEKALFAQAKPLGFILFQRNIENAAQLGNLVNEIRSCVGWHCPVLIDQEGGRVARLREPDWPEFPPARHFGKLMETDETTATLKLKEATSQTSYMLSQAGINVNCTPVLDRLCSQTVKAIGDRAYSADNKTIIKCADIVCRTYLEHHIIPVIKHMPGHGRAVVDSHETLPIINEGKDELLRTDFNIFARIAQSDFKDYMWGMTGHILFPCLDKDRPASVSKKVIKELIRETLGFSGFLISDDIDMKGLAQFGDVEKRSLLALKAGTDAVLYCSGAFEDMKKLENSLPELSDESWSRFALSYQEDINSGPKA